MPILVTCKCGKKFRADEKHNGKQRSCPNCGQSLEIAGPQVSAYDVFVSYSSKDKTTCDALCATFESKGLRCWIAPRDILPGANWGEAIIGGIEQSRVMVLVFSAHSNESSQVKREVERAVSKGIPVIPLRIEDVKLSRAMEYFISSQHWLDALTPPLEKHLEELARKVIRLLTDEGNPPPTTSQSGFDSIPMALPIPEPSAASLNTAATAQPTLSPIHSSTLVTSSPVSTRPATRLDTWWSRMSLTRRWTYALIGMLAIGLILWSFGQYFKSSPALARLRINSPDVEVSFQGQTFGGGDVDQELECEPGESTLLIAFGDKKYKTNSFTLRRGNNPELNVKLVKGILTATFGEIKIWNPSAVGSHPPRESSQVQTIPTPSMPNASSNVPNDSKLKDVSKSTFELDGPPGVIATWFEVGQGPVIHSMAFSADGRHCLIGHEDNALSYWEVATGQRIHIFKDLGGPVDSVSFSPDGNSAISIAGKSKPIQWDLRTLKKIREYDGPGSLWRAATFAPDGRHVLVGGKGSPNLVYWDTFDGKTTSWVGHEGPVSAIAFSGNGQSAISGDSNGGTIVWSATKGEQLFEFKKLEGAVACLRLSPDGLTAFSGNYTSAPRIAPAFVRVWSLHSGQPMEMRRMPGTFFEISADATRILGNGEGNAPHSPTMMLDFKRGQWCESTYPCESPRYVCTVRTISSDGRLALIAGQDRRLLLWRLPKQ